MAQGKRIRKAKENVVAEKIYTLDEALAIAKKSATAKFDETIEFIVNLGIDTKQSDQTVRGAVNMPNGLGKTVRVAVFAKGDKAEEAKKAGADIVGAEELVEMITKGDMNFERCIATPDMMALVGRVGKQLGPRGLMPNPKLGTVTPNVGEAVKAAKSGQVEFRAEKAGIMHAGVGKASFTEKALKENIQALFDALQKAKPSSAKGSYIRKVHVSSTMGPSLQVDIASIAA